MRNTPEAFLSVAGTPTADRKGQWSWAIFQWARDLGGSVIVVFIFAPYFTGTVVGDPVTGQALWGHLNAIAGACTGLMGPFLGAIADTTGRRKPWLVVFVGVMIVASNLLWWSMPGGAGLGVFLSATIVVFYTVAYNFSDIFQSSMLPSIAPPQRVSFLSGLGISLSQASTVFGLSILLFAFMLPGEVNWSFVPAHALFGIDPSQHENSRIAGPFSGIWLLLFSLPLFLYTPDGARKSRLGLARSVVSGMRQVWHTVRELKHYRNVATFLVARTFFNDGQVAIMIFSSIYAAGVFKWGALTLTCYALILSLVSVTGALFGGWLCDRFGAKQAIVAGITGAAIGLLLAISITPNSIFFFITFNPIPITHLPFFRTVPELLYMIIAVTTCA